MAHVVAVLRKLRYPVTERRLRDWIRRSYLPPLSQRGRGQGRGKVYYWPQRDIIRRAAVISELLQWRGRADLLPLMLWMLVYSEAAEDARSILLLLIRERIEALTAGVASGDTEELADHLSGLARSAGRSTQKTSSGSPEWPVEAQVDAMELVLNVRANPEYVPSSDLIDELLGVQSSTHRNVVADPTPDGDMDTATWIDVIRFVQSHVASLHRRQAALERASAADMHQAQTDLSALIAAVRPHLEPIFRQRPAWMTYKYNLLANVGSAVVPVLLALRQDGFGQWVDLASALLTVLGQPATVAAYWEQDEAKRAALLAQFRPMIDELLPP